MPDPIEDQWVPTPHEGVKKYLPQTDRPDRAVHVIDCGVATEAEAQGIIARFRQRLAGP